MTLRIVFMGTPDFAVPTLRAVAAAGHDIRAVYSQPPRRAGRRGLALTPSPVQEAAEALGLPVRTPPTLREAGEQEAFSALGVDVAVVVAYGLLLPKPVLDAPRLGCFNGHASILPRWRGAAPIQRSIMAGDAETGMMIMRMEEGLDTGPVALMERVPIGDGTTAGDLAVTLAEIGARLMVDTLQLLAAGTVDLVAQAADGIVYARKIDKAEARIDWARPAREVLRHIHGLSPAPGAWCEFGLPAERLKVLRCEPAEGRGLPGSVLDDRLTVACADGAVRLREVQRAGGRPMPAEAFLAGVADLQGKTLT